MSDVKQFLHERLDRAQPDIDAAMEKTLRRQRLRARRKRGTAVVVAIAVFVGAGFGLWMAFRPAVAGRPAGEPTPAPSTDQLARTALADAYGLELTTFDHQHPCKYFIDAVSLPHQPDEATLGYCIESVPGDLIHQWRVGERLGGFFPSTLEQHIFTLGRQLGHGTQEERSALLTQLHFLQTHLQDEKASPPPTSCAGHELTTTPDTSAKEVRGTQADDYVVLYAGEQYVTNGGTDTICDPFGNVIATVVDDGTPFPQPYIPPLTGRALIDALQLTPMAPNGTCDGITAEMLRAQRYCIPTELAPTQLARWRILTQLAGTIPTQEEIQAQALLYSEKATGTPTSQPTLHSETSPRAGSATPQSAPLEARIECAKDGSTRLPTSEVQARPDGVHLHVENNTGEPVSIDGLGVEVDANPGAGDYVASTPPGPVRVACSPINRQRGKQSPTRPLTIVDPGGLWVSPELQCPAGDLVGELSIDGYEKPSFKGDPVNMPIIFNGVQPTDAIERAAYPESTGSAEVRVVRDGKVLATVHFFTAPDGGWVPDGAANCSGTGITFGFIQ
ncbi:MAG: hypothetical protein M3P18_13785 [Actinomycetota bacterium]|nr:hypothetical protein [Actinomycetota bacterium]